MRISIAAFAVPALCGYGKALIGRVMQGAFSRISLYADNPGSLAFGQSDSHAFTETKRLIVFFVIVFVQINSCIFYR